MSLPVEISKLTTKQRLVLIELLWDSLTTEDVQLTSAQQAEVTRRMATFDADARGAAPWDDIEHEFASKSRAETSK
ncbi:addiction module protein [Bradyrhizobium sp. SRS-191]|uniref:addiction module protein n=1 Tax=Bradyrhizobium sp. SRS-191 TaxID=2962606 RepID=UPI00211E9531|nr:addiction module protein [Bradyrhizobium sp. SRS-191]